MLFFTILLFLLYFDKINAALVTFIVKKKSYRPQIFEQ